MCGGHPIIFALIKSIYIALTDWFDKSNELRQPLPMTHNLSQRVLHLHEAAVTV